MEKALVGIIGGTGLGDALIGMMRDVVSRRVRTPFGSPSGPITLGQLGTNRVAFLNRHGPGHRLGPSCVPYAANIFALKQLGVRAIIATGAIGSLRRRIRPGDLVAVDQFIDKTYRRLSTFFDAYGAVHCEFAEPVCPRLKALLVDIARQGKISLHPSGTYVCMEGPQFSTRAESLMHRAWGGDLIGMTAMPEARLAREAQICYCLIGLVSDYDCWQVRSSGLDQGLLAEISANIQKASEQAIGLVGSFVSTNDRILDESCTCRHSLDHAVWTDKGAVDQAVERRYRILFE